MSPHDDSSDQGAQGPFPPDDLNSLLRDAAARGTNNPTRVRVDQLLEYWNVKRRTSETISAIHTELQKYDLTTKPALTDVWITNEVQLIKERRKKPSEGDTQPPRETSTSHETDDAWKIGALEAANAELRTTTPNDSIVYALTWMTHFNYSQLPIVDKKKLVGVISNRSIALVAANGNRVDKVYEAAERPEFREPDTPVKDIIDVVNTYGYVIIVRNSVPKGIITPADLSEEFYRRDRPIAIIGRIETRVRNRVLRKLNRDDYEQFIPKWNRSSENAAPPMGAYVKLFQDNPDLWKKMQWHIDFDYFIEKFDRATDVRNELMHFAPDPPGADEITEIERFADTLLSLTQSSETQSVG